MLQAHKREEIQNKVIKMSYTSPNTAVIWKKNPLYVHIQMAHSIMLSTHIILLWYIVLGVKML